MKNMIYVLSKIVFISLICIGFISCSSDLSQVKTEEDKVYDKEGENSEDFAKIEEMLKDLKVDEKNLSEENLFYIAEILMEYIENNDIDLSSLDKDEIISKMKSSNSDVIKSLVKYIENENLNNEKFEELVSKYLGSGALSQGSFKDLFGGKGDGSN